MLTRIRFVRWCVMVLGMVLAVACGHGQPGRGAEEHIAEQVQAATLAWPHMPVVSAGKVGTLPGGGSVGPAGDYHYSLPIEVPIGRAGMTPSLSLSYSSTAGNGVVGVGWALGGGTSVIAPCNKTIAADGIAVADVELCLDGVRLIAVGPQEYRTAVDGFARITSTNDAADFPWQYKVELQSGRLRYYARLTYKSPQDAWATLLFRLSRETDSDGNEIRYSYRDDVEESASAPYEIKLVESLLSEIAYGNLATTSEPSRKIVFNYSEIRPDPIYSDVQYDIANFDYTDYVNPNAPAPKLPKSEKLTHRLSSIDCYAPGATDQTKAAQLAWTYSITYTQSTGSERSLLRTVTRIGAMGGRTYAKEFSWEQTKGGTYADATGNTIGPFGDPSSVLTALDVDNDGKDELLGAMPLQNFTVPVLFSTGASGPVLGNFNVLLGLTSATLIDSRIVDIDGDGVPEIVAPDRSADLNGTVQYRLYKWSNALSDYSETIPQQPLWHEYKSFSSSEAEQPIFFADYDGDGLPDLVQARHFGGFPDPSCEESPAVGRPKCLGYDWYSAHNEGNGQFSSQQLIVASEITLWPEADTYFAPFSGSPFPSLATADRAGNASLFAVAKYSSTVSGQVMRISGEWAMPSTALADAQEGASLCAFGDFRGRGSLQKECFDPFSAAPFLPAPYWRTATFDVDADGRQDLLAYNFATDPSGHFYVTGGSYRIYYDVAGTRHQDPITQVPLVGGDFDGDGIQDAYLYDRTTDTSYVGLQIKPTRDLMNAVADETQDLKNKPLERVTYSQRWSTDPVTPIACQHPQRCLRRGMNVVIEHDVYQGADVDAFEHHLYSYDDPRADVHGAGFLGFGTVREWNPDRPSETITTYDNKDSAATEPGVYRAFLPTVVRTYVPIDPIDPADKRTAAEPLTVRISETTSHYESRYPYPDAGGPSFAGKTHFFYRDSWTSTEWESGANLDWSPFKRISNHFTGSSKPQPALRVRTGFKSVNDYGNDTYAVETTVGGVSVEVSSVYEQDIPQSFYIDRVQTRLMKVTGANSTTPPAPRRVDYTYDPLGRLASVSVEQTRTNDPDVQSKVEFDYTNGHGLVTTVTRTAPGETPRHTYVEYDPDEGIFPRKTWNDLGHTSWSLFHPMFGVISDHIDVDGIDTQVQLDDFGRVVQTVRAGLAATAVITSYKARKDSNGDLIGSTVETTGLGIVRTFATFDSLGRIVLDEHTGFDGLPIIRQTDYDTLGRVVGNRRPITLYPGQMYLPTQDVTSYTFDSLDRLRSIVAPDKTTVTQTPTFWQTDTVGPVPPSQVPGFVAPHSYVVRDVDGRVVTSTQVSSTGKLATTFLYGDFNEVLTVTDPTTKNVTTMSYDQLGRRKDLKDPDAGISTLNYNGFGELTRVDVPSLDGSPVPSSTKYFHDVIGRITATDNADGTTKLHWDVSPNGAGKLANRSSPDGTTETFTYNALGQLAQQVWKVPRDSMPAESFDMVMGYDDSGRLSTVAYPDVPGRPSRFKVEQSYVNGYLQQIGPKAVPGQPTPVQFWTVNSRNSDDQLLTGSSGNKVTETRTYEPKTGRLSTILAGSIASPIPVLSLSYAYWPDGGVKSRIDAPRNRSETFDYDDGLRRLTGWHLTNSGVTRNVGYHYDSIGNLDQVTTNNVVTETNTPDPLLPHALAKSLQAGVASSFKYDARGRQYSTPDRTVVFTEQNLPKAVTSAAGITDFLYDALGRRVKKRNAQGGSETISLGGMYERRKLKGTTQHIFYVQGSDGHRAQISYDEATKVELHEYVHPDALGSASAVTDDNKVVKRFDNEPFGKRIQPNGANFSGIAPNVQTGFTGHQMDDDLGLVNMKGRIYDPSQRRFISPDPLVARPMNAQSYNRYSYVYNNPLNLTDPSGFCSTDSKSKNPCSYCEMHPGTPPCENVSGPGTNTDPSSLGNEVSNPNAAVCGGSTGHPCPTPVQGGHYAPHEPAPPPVASKFHMTTVPVTDAVTITPTITPDQERGRGDSWEVRHADLASNGNWGDINHDAAWVEVHCPTCVDAYNGLYMAGALIMMANDLSHMERGVRDILALQSGPVPASGVVPVYRVIRPDEDINVGLSAKDPSATYKVEGHILNGSRPGWKSQYISTTTSSSVAMSWSTRSGNRVVAIDLSKVTGRVIDLSTAAGRSLFLRGITATRFAEASSEVLVEGAVPAAAITPFFGF